MHIYIYTDKHKEIFEEKPRNKQQPNEAKICFIRVIPPEYNLRKDCLILLVCRDLLHEKSKRNINHRLGIARDPFVFAFQQTTPLLHYVPDRNESTGEAEYAG